jgi:hypothetical protein
MDLSIKGIVSSEPRVEGNRIAFILWDEANRREVSCLSSLKFDNSTTAKGGDSVTLTGDWAKGARPMLFILDRLGTTEG